MPDIRPTIQPDDYFRLRFLQDASLSPDGRWVAYQSRESGQFEVYVQSFPEPTGRWQVSTNGGNAPEWRADGKELYYLSPGAVLMAVEIREGPGFEAGLPVALFPSSLSTNAFAGRRYRLSTDGQRFLLRVPAGDRSIPPITVVMNWAEELGAR